MSNLSKSYFLAPTWDYPPPPRGPIRLGNVIASPVNPVPALFATPIDFMASQATAVGNGDHEDMETRFETEKKDVTWSRDKLRAGKFGVWTEFLRFLGLGVDIGVSWNEESEEIYTFKTMTTITISPTLQYLTAALSSPTLCRYLRLSRFSPHTPALFVVTAIKTVSGAACKSSSSRSRTKELSLELDGSLLTGGTAPVSLGPSAGRERKNGEKSGFEGGDDFVFAYGLRRVMLREKKKGEKEVVQEEWTKGAMYGNDMDIDEGEDSGFEFVVLKQESVNVEELGCECKRVTEDSDDEELYVIARQA